ncbi:MAG: sterol desaturase family protein [bacterium]|nr:sterol desaturase family protein [bacterium]
MKKLAKEIDADDKHFGSGWISGFAGLVLALLGLAMVLCFCYPQFLTVEGTRKFYVDNVTIFRILTHVVLVAAFACALISSFLRSSRMLGFTAMAIILLATLMGGSRATELAHGDSDYYLGLDFFILNLIMLGAIFIPIERFFRQNDQPILRYEWREDLLYFFISTLFVQALTFLSLAPSLAVLGATQWAGGIRGAIASQPVVLQFLEIMFLTDLVQYWFHRSFHQFPWLWRFHAIHHSAQRMDWIAGSRMHVLEVILLRAFTTLPMYVMGFSETALYAYIFFVYLMSVFIHSNVRFRFGPLAYLIATPKFHHWHHGVEREAIDKNFAIHFPVLDMMFGTFHLPKNRWPEGYGIGGHPIPKGFWKQFLYPFGLAEPITAPTPKKDKKASRRARAARLNRRGNRP